LNENPVEILKRFQIAEPKEKRDLEDHVVLIVWKFKQA
jgi:hypothetical protein